MKYFYGMTFARLRLFFSKYYFLFLILVLSVSYFYFGTYRNWPYKIESDGKYYYQYLVSGMLDGDVDFTNNYRAERYEWMKLEIDHYRFRENINSTTGKPGNVFTIGSAILWAPFFVAATITGKILEAVNLPIDMNPYGKFFQYMTMYAGVFYCIVGLFLLHRLLKQYYSDSISKISIWLILIMTPLYYYSIFEVSMSHVYDFFTFVLVLYTFANISEKKSFSYFMLLGFVGALHVLIRTQNIITVFVFSVMLVFQHWRKLRSLNPALWGKFGIYTLVFSIGLLPLLLVNNYLYGSPLAIPQGSGFINWGSPQVLSLLFSTRNGLFSHHPILFLGLIGYIGFLQKSFQQKQRVPLFVALLISVLCQVYINSTVADWWAGHSYGQRRLVFSLPLFAFGIGYLLQRVQIKFNRNFQRFIVPMILFCTAMGIYFTLIHVFLWDYDQPHNIFKWMFYYAPIN